MGAAIARPFCLSTTWGGPAKWRVSATWNDRMRDNRFSQLRANFQGIDCVEANSTRRFARHTHEQFGIGVIVRGAQVSASGRGPVEAGAGDVITVNPGEVHDGVPIGDHGRHWRMAYLDPDVIAALVRDIKDDSRDCELRHPVLRSPELARVFAALWTALQADTQPLHTEALLIDLTSALLADKPISTTLKAPASIRRARELIDDDPARPLELADLAQAACVSKFQLLRGFSTLTGLTPHAYLMQKRTDLARRLIKTGVSLANAAIASGFADQSHMTRVFAAKYGVTPGAYAAAFC